MGNLRAMNKEVEQIEHPHYKKTLYVVIASQIFGGLGLAAGVTVGAMIAKQMLGTDAYAGIPSFLFTLGSAIAVLLMGRITAKQGRRKALSLGYLLGSLGALGVIFAVQINNLYLFFIALFIYGSGSATNLFCRYAGADLAKDNQKATAVSVALISTTVGAVAAPNMSGIMGGFALYIGFPKLTGIFMLAFIAYSAAGVIIFLMMRPDPYLLSMSLNDDMKKSNDKDVISSIDISIIKGTIVMVLSQIIMVTIMTVTPLHMTSGGDHMNSVGLVIGLHIGAMYLPSLLTGRLVKRIGTTWMGCITGVTLVCSCLLSYLSSSNDLILILISLLLLGVGWNFGLITGTSILLGTDGKKTSTKIQSIADVLVSVFGAIGGGMSGVIMNQFGFTFLTLIGFVLSLIILIISVGKNNKNRINKDA